MCATKCLAVLLAAALTLPLVARAEIYKWVDARGVTNYASQLPGKGVAVERIGPEDASLSTIPTPRRYLTARSAPTTLPPALEAQRVALAPAVPPNGVTAGSAASDWQAQCYAERRVNCTAPTAATFDVVPSFSPYDVPVRVIQP